MLYQVCGKLTLLQLLLCVGVVGFFWGGGGAKNVLYPVCGQLTAAGVWTTDSAAVMTVFLLLLFWGGH